MDINFAMTTVKLPDDKEELLALIDQCQAQIESINKVETERRREEQKKFDAQYRKEFGARLKAARQAKGFTQKDVARELNISSTGYSKYEQGRADLPLSAVIKILKCLNVSADYLLGLTENFKGN